MNGAVQLQRPVPLVCEHCLTIIQADESCTWRERTDTPEGIGSRGFIGTHDDCPDRSLERWVKIRRPCLPLGMLRAGTVADIITRRDLELERQHQGGHP